MARAVKIPDASQAESESRLREASRTAALSFEVVRVWKQGGVLYAEIENTRDGFTYTMTERA
jgi:hypothetical protein